MSLNAIPGEKEPALRIAAMADLDDTKVCYWKDDCGWWIYLPGCGAGVLSGHTVVENQDGTITVMPSIKMAGHRQGAPSERHGYLTGVWKEV